MIYYVRFGTKTQLRLHQKSSHKTAFGGCLTILLIVLMLAAIYNFSQELYLKENPQTFIQQNYLDPNMNFHLNFFQKNEEQKNALKANKNIDKNNIYSNEFFNFAIGLYDIETGEDLISDDKFQFDLINKIEKQNITGNKLSFNQIVEENHIKLNKCSHFVNQQNNFQLLFHYNDVPQNIFNKLYCIDQNQIANFVSIGGSKELLKNNNQYIYSLHIKIIECNQLSSNDKNQSICLNKNELQNLTKRAMFKIFIMNNAINQRNFNNPNHKFLTHLETEVSLGNSLIKQMNIKLQHEQILSDVGVVSASYSSKNFLSYLRHDEKILEKSQNSSVIFESIIKMDQISIIYTRKYTKILNILAQIGGVVKSFFYILLFVSKPVYNKLYLFSLNIQQFREMFYYESLLNALYSFGKKKDKKKQKVIDIYLKQKNQNKKERSKVLAQNNKDMNQDKNMYQTKHKSLFQKSNTLPTNSNIKKTFEKSSSLEKTDKINQDNINFRNNQSLNFIESKNSITEAGQQQIRKFSLDQQQQKINQSINNISQDDNQIVLFKQKDEDEQSGQSKSPLNYSMSSSYAQNFQKLQDILKQKLHTAFKSEASRMPSQLSIQDQESSSIIGNKNSELNQNQTEIEEREKTSELRNKDFDDEQIKEMQQIIEQEFEQNMPLRFKLKDYLEHLIKKKTKMSQDVVREGLKKIDEKLDIVYIFQKLQEIDKLKMLLLDKQQLQLFEFLPKPMLEDINWNDDENGRRDMKKHSNISPKRKQTRIESMGSFIGSQGRSFLSRQKKNWNLFFRRKTLAEKAALAFKSYHKIIKKQLLSLTDVKLIEMLDEHTLFMFDTDNFERLDFLLAHFYESKQKHGLNTIINLNYPNIENDISSNEQQNQTLSHQDNEINDMNASQNKTYLYTDSKNSVDITHNSNEKIQKISKNAYINQILSQIEEADVSDSIDSVHNSQKPYVKSSLYDQMVEHDEMQEKTNKQRESIMQILCDNSSGISQNMSNHIVSLMSQSSHRIDDFEQQVNDYQYKSNSSKSEYNCSNNQNDSQKSNDICKSIKLNNKYLNINSTSGQSQKQSSQNAFFKQNSLQKNIISPQLSSSKELVNLEDIK